MYGEPLDVFVNNMPVKEEAAVSVFHSENREAYLKWVECFSTLPCAFFPESMTVVVQFPSREMQQKVLKIMRDASPAAAV